jgi:UDP-N-acetylglucosamine 2-epimerase
MHKVFFEQLELPEAKYNLEVGSGSHAEQTGKMLIGIEKVLLKEKPDVVLVEGATKTCWINGKKHNLKSTMPKLIHKIVFHDVDLRKRVY